MVFAALRPALIIAISVRFLLHGADNFLGLLVLLGQCRCPTGWATRHVGCSAMTEALLEQPPQPSSN